MLTAFCLLFGGCGSGGTNHNKPNDKEEITYEKIYNVLPETAFPVRTGKAMYRAVEGCHLKTEQGYNGWFYENGENGEYALLTATEKGFSNGNVKIEGGAVTATDVSAVRRFDSPVGGTARVTGTVRWTGGAAARFKIEKNGVKIYPEVGDYAELNKGDLAGVYYSFDTELEAGDKLRFSLVSADAEETKAVWLPVVDFTGTERDLHYDAGGDFVGDVHPYWENGKLYMFHLLTDMTWRSSLATSADFINFEKTEIKASENNSPEQPNYYVLGVTKDGDVYRSYFGLGDAMGSSVSKDLITWESATGVNDNFDTTYKAYHDYETFPAGGRDPYMFYDPDANRFRLVGLYYKRNDDTVKNSSIGMRTTTTEKGDVWNKKTEELINFPDAAAGEPECPQMIKIGDRWYLLASILSSRGIEGASYWAGDKGKPIIGVDWKNATERKLDGGNLVAPQICAVGDKTYIFGWIPQQYKNDAWGGYMNLAREIYASENGELYSRLDPYYLSLINAGRLYGVNQAGDMQLPNSYGRSIITCKMNFASGTKKMSVKLKQQTLNAEMSVNKSADGAYLEITCPGQSNPLCSRIKIEDAANYDVTAVVEGGIIELFVNSRYALTARIPFVKGSYTVNLGANGGSFENVNVYKLADLDRLNYQY